ncbi:MAG: methylated-DNA--[Bacteroidetes bacterium]|nr:methylated-DNA--[protein]-cysteine S-methyltransferase [Bacteroidota bacterium]
MNYTCFDSIIGKIFLFGNNKEILKIFINNGSVCLELIKQCNRQDNLFIECKKQILEYLAGKRKNFDINIKINGSEFQTKVWNELLNIPYGTLKTYKDVAVNIGHPTASRAVGLAVHNNPLPIIIPCHRVIGSNGKLTGYAYGLELKQFLISLESNNKK